MADDDDDNDDTLCKLYCLPIDMADCGAIRAYHAHILDAEKAIHRELKGWFAQMRCLWRCC